MIKVLEEAVPLDKSEMPEKMKRGAPLGKEGALVADLLKLLLKIRAREIEVAARLLTKADEMEALAAGVRDLPILKGWRYDVFGRDALELVEGKLAFAVESGRLKMTHVDEMQASMEEALAADTADGADTVDANDGDGNAHTEEPAQELAAAGSAEVSAE